MSWFDESKLLPGESLIREAHVRLRTQYPPGWWEGALVLTTDRLFFLPFVHNPLVNTDLAFWLADTEELPAGRNRMRVRKLADASMPATFQFLGPWLGPRGILGERGKIWVFEMRRARRRARPAYAFDLPAAAEKQHHAAAG